MSKPHAKSTLKEMKDYIRKNKLNKAEVKLTMRKSEMVSALKKMGHWDNKNDGSTTKQKVTKKQSDTARKNLKKIISKPAPKTAPKKKPAPKKKKYYVGYDMLDFDTWEMFGKPEGYKEVSSYGHFDLFSIMSVGEPDDPFWENAPYRSDKKFSYNSRFDHKAS